MTTTSPTPVAAPAATTLTDVAEAIRSGATTSVAVVTEAIAAANRYDRVVGVYTSRFDEQALESAATADAALAAGEPIGPLHGVPIGVKDIISTKEGVTTAQSVVHSRDALSGDAVVVQRLRDAGAIITGKLTTMEFAIGAPDSTKPFPVPRNSWSLEHWTGGSSSGSGSSVSLGLVAGALGTDTGGSIRIPASYCGISGLMATYGRVPKSGTVPLGFTLDHIGPMARSAKDCAVMLGVLAGAHPSDPTVVDVPVGDYAGALTGDLTGVRVGVDRLDRLHGPYDPALHGAMDAALAVLTELGATISEIELPFYSEVMTAQEILMFSEAFAYHLPDFQTRWLDFGAGTRQSVGTAMYYSAADHLQAQRVRRVGQKAIKEVLGQVDLVLTPTTGAAAPTFDRLDGWTTRPEGFGPIFTGYWDMTGNPAISVPFGFDAAGLPLGLQIAGRWFDEELVLRAGDAFQRLTDWHLHKPEPLG